MISLLAFFWIMVAFFALIGALRGWTREVIATAGLVLSLFALNQFEGYISSFTGLSANVNVLPMESIDAGIRRSQFYLYALIHIFIAFVSYQGPLLAGSRIGERLRVRDTFQDKIMGALVGAVNGYLIIGTLWAYLHTLRYPFPEYVQAPGPEIDWVIGWLPNFLLTPYLSAMVVVVVLFVIIVLI